MTRTNTQVLSCLASPQTETLYKQIVLPTDIVNGIRGESDALFNCNKAITKGSLADCLAQCIPDSIFNMIIMDDEKILNATLINNYKTVFQKAHGARMKFGADPVESQIRLFLEEMGSVLDFVALQINPFEFKTVDAYQKRIAFYVQELKRQNPNIVIVVQLNLNTPGSMTNDVDPDALINYYNAVKNEVGLQVFFREDGTEVEILKKIYSATGYM